MLQIYTLEVTPFAQNARVLFCTETGHACVVDPGGDVAKIIGVVTELKASSAEILLTHAHIDHGGGVARCLQALKEVFNTDTKLYAHRDQTLRGSISQQALLFGLSAQEYQDVPEPDVILDEGDTFTVGKHAGEVIWTPGHAPDHLSIYFSAGEFELYDALHPTPAAERTTSPVLIAGDALFAGSIGRTDLPGGSFPQLISSIKEKLLVLPAETIVFAGHGPNTTIGDEQSQNPFLQ